MKIIKAAEFLDFDSLKDKIFIYPTDTIYGIGCDALDREKVERIREIKERDERPMSVIAPNFDFIEENFDIEGVDLGKYLPGPYTLLLKKKDSEFLSWISGNEYVGIRMPDCEFCRKLQEIGVPIVTTSVNLSGEKAANCVEEINEDILGKADMVFDDGILNGKASMLIKDGEEISR